MARRMHDLGSAGTWEELGESARGTWDEAYGPAEEWPVQAADDEVPGPNGPVPIRIYTPTAHAYGPRAVLVWCHGGAFMHGDLDMPEADHVARGVAGRADAIVVSVDYRLCDEPPELGGMAARSVGGSTGGVHAPVPLDDVCAVVRWARESAEELGGNPLRIAVGGASAGGNLAAAASLRLTEEGTPLAASLLLYPVAHAAMPEPSAEEDAALTQIAPVLRFLPERTGLMATAYVGGDPAEADAYVFPSRADAERLAGLPRTYIEADEFDDLRVSARAYADQLAQADVDVEYTVRRGVAHGHLNRVGLAEARESMDRMGQIMREL
ncbi:esterase [Brachybacterium endophyticum]|uniref:Esterase n=1 Tax=Brachybacterium endophyticum TaxID=2182385 RepID=A0A2U2RK62_9MICO|nr:alpha/beta hydrolase [Brachybacterium endophyticum]PWH06269.1 esterase [Brachybacterium endophyticum]